MAILGFPFDHSQQNFDGLAATNAMAAEGIKSTDNLLAVLSWDAAYLVTGHDISDFTVANGTITGGTINLAGRTGVVIWTRAAAA